MGLFDKIVKGLDQAFSFGVGLDKKIKDDTLFGFDLRNLIAPEIALSRAVAGGGGGSKPQEIPLSFTTPNTQALFKMSAALGFPEFMENFQTNIAAGTLSQELMDGFNQYAVTFAENYQGTLTPRTDASLTALNYMTNLTADTNFESESFLTTIASFGAQIISEGTLATDVESSELNDMLMETQRLTLEQQQFDLRQSRLAFERDGITTFMSFIPSASRMAFLSKLIQTPKYAQLFFGGGGGPADGPYVGGVTASGIGTGGGLPTSTPAPFRTRTVTLP